MLAKYRHLNVVVYEQMVSLFIHIDNAILLYEGNVHSEIVDDLDDIHDFESLIKSIENNLLKRNYI